MKKKVEEKKEDKGEGEGGLGEEEKEEEGRRSGGEGEEEGREENLAVPNEH